MNWRLPITESGIVLGAGLTLIVIHVVGVFVSRELGIAVHSVWLAFIMWSLWKTWQYRHSEVGLKRSIAIGCVTWLSWWSYLLFLEKIEVLESGSMAWWLMSGASLLGFAYMSWACWKLARLHEAQRSASSSEEKKHGQVP